MSLNDYHIERSKIALKAVEEMSKYPSSLEEMREQTRRVLSGETRAIKNHNK